MVVTVGLTDQDPDDGVVLDALSPTGNVFTAQVRVLGEGLHGHCGDAGVYTSLKLLFLTR